MKKLTYKDFKIGQTVICDNIGNDDVSQYFWEQHLTIGKKYIIEDLEFRFPDQICVRSDNNKVSMFCPILLFSSIKTSRKKKLKKINNL